MARVTKAKLLQSFFVVAKEAETAQREWAVPAGLVSLAFEEVASAGCDLTSSFASELAEIADEFAMERATQSYSGEPGRQKQLLKALKDGSDVQTVLDALAPEFVIELTTYIHPEDSDRVLDPTGEPADVAARVRVAAARLLLDYQPARGRRPDFALETAVRALVGLLESALGNPLQVAGNKNNGLSCASPNCVGSRAMAMLLTGIDPRLPPAAVMNMILKVRSRPDPTGDHLMALLRSNPINALDASLLPGREEAIRQLRDDPNYSFA